MFISVTTIEVPNEEKVAQMEENFEKSIPGLKKIDGFLGFELWKQEGQVKSVARWENKEAFDRYVKSDLFKKHHHKGGGGERPKASIDFFEAKSF